MDDQLKTPDQQPASPPAPDNQAQKTAAPAGPADPVVNTSSVTPLQTQSDKPRSGGRMRWLALIVLLVAAIGGTYYALNRVNKPDQTVVQNTKKSVALVRVGVTQPFPSDFYPNIESSILPNEINNQIFEGLTKYQNENQIVPDLAQSWTNPNSTTWTFKLLPGVKFHNGRALTSKEVKASLEALATSDFGSSYATTIKTITAVDNLTVQIVTSAPDPLLPSELANLWIYDTGSGKTNDPGNGTGPYTIKPGTKLTTDSLQLVANDAYHGGVPQVKELDFKFYADDKSQLDAVNQKQVDIADLGTQSAVNAVTSQGFKAYAAKNTQVYFLMPNTLKAGSPLQKPAVRQAMYEALDPAAIVKADGRTGSPATQLVPQEIPGFNPAVKRPTMDATKAKADLATAGYPTGFTITFTYFAPHQALAVEVQKEMAAIGVKLTLDPQTVGKDLAKKALGGQTDLFYYGYGSNLIDASDVIQPLIVDTANYKNDQVDKLYSQAATTFNTAARLKLLQQINQVAMDDVAVLPLFTPEAEFYAVKSNLVVHTDNLSNYIGVDFWKVYSQ